MKRPEFVIAPEGCSDYLTPGKAYRAFAVFGDGGFSIRDDDGDIITCRLHACPHLYDQDWVIPDNKPEAEKTSLQEGIIAAHTEVLITHNEVLRELQKCADALQADFDKLAARMSDGLTEAVKPDSVDDASASVNLLCKLAGVDVSFKHVHDVRASFNFAGPDSAEISEITLRVKV